MLRINNLSLQQGAFTLTVPTFFVEGQSVTALVGASGSGKSTLLAAIAGFLPVTSGEIAVSNTRSDGTVRQDVAMVFQDNNLFPHLSVVQNVSLGVRPDLRLTKDQKELVSEALARVGLEGLDDRMPGTLSGGQQSRVAIARLLVQRRPLWLLDEPFAALGPAMRKDMLRLVRDTAAEHGSAVVLVTHQPDDVREIASHIAFAADGLVGQPVSTEDFFMNPPAEIQVYLGKD